MPVMDMEADWEFEIAPDAPMIDAAWTGFVDLRRFPEKALTLVEALHLPTLGPVLVRMNDADSPVWTAKCDVWTTREFDPDELESPHDSANTARACYIDLLARDEQMWSTMDSVAEWCRSLSLRLRSVPLRQCRADLVVRRAMLTADQAGMGVTAYVMGCGVDELDAASALSQAAHALADVVCKAQATRA
jgi:hypothetical protein